MHLIQKGSRLGPTPVPPSPSLLPPLILESPQALIQHLKSQLSSLQIPVKLLFDSLDLNKDQQLTFLEFKQAFKQTGLALEDSFIRKFFGSLGGEEGGEGVISFMSFLKCFYGEEGVLGELRGLVREKFGGKEQFDKFVEKWMKREGGEEEETGREGKIGVERKKRGVRKDDFVKMIGEVSGRYSKMQLVGLFEELDWKGKEVLETEELSEIWEHQVRKCKIPDEEINIVSVPVEKKVMNRGEVEKFNELAKTISSIPEASEIKSIPSPSILQLLKLPPPSSFLPSPSLLPSSLPPPPSSSLATKHHIRQILLQVQTLLHLISKKIKDFLVSKGKTLRNLFDMFSKKRFGYWNMEELGGFLNFLMKGEVDLRLVESLFRWWGLKKGMEFEDMQEMVRMGEEISLINLKLRFRFGTGRRKIYNHFSYFYTFFFSPLPLSKKRILSIHKMLKKNVSMHYIFF